MEIENMIKNIENLKRPILVCRKEENNRNVGFWITTGFDIVNKYKPLEYLIKEIESGKKYYTKNPDGSFSIVEIINDNPKYLRSKSNHSNLDNIDRLPIGK